MARPIPWWRFASTTLAGLLHDTNRLGEPEPLRRRALSIDEAAYGPTHPTGTRDLHNLAMLLRDTDRLAEAEPLFRQALAVLHAAYGLEHPNTQRVAANYQHLLAVMGQSEARIEETLGEVMRGNG